MIIALAGRRIDAPDAEEKRFPLKRRASVRRKIIRFFKKNNITELISSGACGADLLAQAVAKKLKIRQHIILPFGREKFRKTSVTDRPGYWGKLFDEICDEAERQGNLIVLKGFEDDEEKAYSAVTTEILKYTKNLQTEKEKLLAVAVWEGKAKDKTNETDSFIEQAKIRKIRTTEILIRSY
ncbi:MAG: hypothetical protein M3Q99_08060 [Acidobacteriota bacterium]|nr:hypothetical protein [Acidobacteriota bacterium]